MFGKSKEKQNTFGHNAKEQWKIVEHVTRSKGLLTYEMFNDFKTGGREPTGDRSHMTSRTEYHTVERFISTVSQTRAYFYKILTEYPNFATEFRAVRNENVSIKFT